MEALGAVLVIFHRVGLAGAGVNLGVSSQDRPVLESYPCGVGP